MSDNKDFIMEPWWKQTKDDYTKYRAKGVDYDVDNLIGRKDYKKYTLTTDDAEATISGVDDARIISPV
jgi:hypothetical protein